MDKILSYDRFIFEKIKPVSSDYSLIVEGGAYGHLTHPFEDLGLTMQDLQDMINVTVDGAFGPDNFVQEKTDGQQLSISWKNGRLIAARNKQHLKNAGENAMGPEELAAKFAGKGDIEVAYNAAMRDLQASIGALSEDDKLKIFNEGRKFASIEVITPVTQNTVPYGQDLLVFHSVVEYDEDGNVVGEDKKAGYDIAKMIEEANSAAQEMFYVRGPKNIDIVPFKDAKKKAKYYSDKLKAIMKDAGINVNSTVSDFVMGSALNKVDELAKEFKVELSEETKEGIARRLGGIDKSYNARQMKKDLGDVAQLFTDLEKKDGKIIKKKIYAPLENLFLEVGTEMMKNMSSFLSANPTEASEYMRKEIESTISTLRKTGGEEEIKKLEHELSRIAAIGGMENIVPTEGITFVFKDKVYKYTGIFAPIHQIRSMLAYRK
jgi:hypothetical protein